MKHYEMERVAKMKENIGELVDFLISNRLEKILDGNMDNVRNELKCTLKELAEDKENGSLVISFLRSSYILNSHEFYIAYYEGEPFVEEEPACVHFNMKGIFNGIEADWREMDEELCQNFIRVFAGEKEEIRRWYMERLYIALECIMKTAVENIQKSKDIDVYYGGYMEDVKAIGCI